MKKFFNGTQNTTEEITLPKFDYTLGENGVIAVRASENAYGIHVLGTNDQLTINGDVSASTDGVDFSAGIYIEGPKSVTVIGAESYVTADTYGISVTDTADGAELVNYGHLTSTNSLGYGLISGADDVNLVNYGLISGESGVYLLGSGKFQNETSGDIEGLRHGVVNLYGHMTFINKGLVQGGPGGHETYHDYAYWGSDDGSRLINRGRMVGDLLLGRVNDFVDTRGGTITGQIFSGLGDDTLITDDAGITLQEDAKAGYDTIKSRVSYTLPQYVERLVLIGSDNIDGTGSDLNNALVGNSGNNVLRGGIGRDDLDGRGGNDKLWGQGGIDTFHFGVGDGHDKIMDFDPITETIFLDKFKHIKTNGEAHDHLETSGADVHLRFGNGDILIFHDRSISDLAHVQFHFVG